MRGDQSTFSRKVFRIVFGLALGAALMAGGGLLGFMGLWTYAGFKTAGDPAGGLLLFAVAVASLFGAGMAFAWGVTDRRLMETKPFGAALAAAGVAVTIWFVSAN
jgi:hypothetical protein